MSAGDDLEARQRKHVMFTWSAQGSAASVRISGGRGARFVDHDGREFLDFESQVFNCNAGHGQASISEAIASQASTLSCAHPAAVFEAKAALGERLARVTPEGISKFFLCLSGAEANENALKMARFVTGRSKIIARRRSYHGASMGALSLTGDPRRWAAEPGLWGVERIEDPYCYRCPFGQTYPGCGVQCAEHLEHVIQMEGPERIAAVFIEGVTGANGGFVPPPEYWPRLRELCTKYGILLVADEVFTGFGRTGKWFAVDHWDVQPDLITMGKGITSGYAPLGAVGLTDRVAAHFDERALQCGLTNYAHPIACAAANATIDLYERDDLIGNAARMGEVLKRGLEALKAKHEVVGDARNLGLFGTLELVTDRVLKTPLVPYNGALIPGSKAARLKLALHQRGLHILLRWNYLFIAPPLCIDEDDLNRGLLLIDDALTEVFA
ncbi:MAG: aminotransferase class III-fold pyridoxal phosphate-dependent enzyme [Myxococcales bacterium]|nr:aminotransferase class III-fold pyridoxal phosphate-dependent enzyme [Myxococcales bacterium]